MEIYRNTVNSVELEVPLINIPYTVTIESANGTSPEQQYIPTTNQIVVPIDVKHTIYDGLITVSMTFNAGESGVITIKEQIQVVTPLFKASDLESTDYAPNDVPELENLVRHVIEAYTCQTFGLTREFAEAYTIDRRAYRLRVPLVEFKGISPRYMTNSTTLTPPKVSADGKTLEFYHAKTDTWFLHERSSPYVLIDGVFGFLSVPADVKRAALLLAGLWGCQQAIWRDRFVESMRTADRNMKYNDGAYLGTGSVTADQLLDKYIDIGWFVI